MTERLFLTFGLLIASVSVAHAQLSSTVTATSDYDFRGVSLSATDPALQASADYAFASGFVASAWISNVDFGDDADIEVDLTLAYSAPLSEGSTWTAGIVSYNWPQSDVVGDYAEAFVGLTAGWLGVKQWFTHDYGGLDESAWYTELNATWPVAQKVSLVAHAGYSYGDYWTRLGGGDLFDYAVGVGVEVGRFNVSAKYTGTTADGPQRVRADIFNNEGRFVLAVATTFPWNSD